MIAAAGVPVELVDRVWPDVAAWIDDACRRFDVWTLEEAYAECQAGRAALWIALDGSQPVGAAVTQCDGKEAVIALVGGVRILESIAATLPPIEAWASQCGAKRMAMDGRKGWVRALKPFGYRSEGTLVIKDL